MKSMNKTRKLSFLAIMLGITVFLDLSPFSAIPIGSVSATILQIPTIITAIILGPIYGMVMGGILGIVSLIHALTRPVTPLDPLFINPLVSVFPRILIGLFTALAFSFVLKIFKGGKRPVASGVAGAVGAIVNTIFVLGALYFVYAKDIIESLGLENNDALLAVIWGIILSNGVIEAIVCSVVSVGVIAAYDSLSRRNVHGKL